MTQFITGSTEERAFTHAADIVLGVVQARQRHDADDAAVMLEDYFSAALRSGLSIATAWTMLFSASTIWLTDVLDEFASATDQSPEHLVQSLALRHAADRAEFGVL